jgi:leucine dehydrogenase
MDPRQNASFDAHERVEVFTDEAVGLAAIIALHSTALGPAMGGCRAATYISEGAALTDALRLSRGMTYKNAMAGLPAGGGKAVLYRLPADSAARTRALEAFGAGVERLGGQYVTAEDVGTSVCDMRAIARATRYVAGLPARDGRAGGDPSPWTALGVFEAMKVAAGRPLKGARVAVQGLGSVGYRLCEHLHAEGARLVVADVVRERAERARRAFGAEIHPAASIHRAAADVFSPNALGAVLNVDTVEDLQAPIVCGGANNQLGRTDDGHRLAVRGVVYAPDYVVNAGGIISVVAEYQGEPLDRVKERVLAIGERLAEILVQARAEGRLPLEVADAIARARANRPSVSSAA